MGGYLLSYVWILGVSSIYCRQAMFDTILIPNTTLYVCPGEETTIVCIEAGTITLTWRWIDSEKIYYPDERRINYTEVLYSNNFERVTTIFIGNNPLRSALQFILFGCSSAHTLLCNTKMITVFVQCSLFEKFSITRIYLSLSNTTLTLEWEVATKITTNATIVSGGILNENFENGTAIRVFSKEADIIINLMENCSRSLLAKVNISIIPTQVNIYIEEFFANSSKVFICNITGQSTLLNECERLIDLQTETDSAIDNSIITTFVTTSESKGMQDTTLTPFISESASSLSIMHTTISKSSTEYRTLIIGSSSAAFLLLVIIIAAVLIGVTWKKAKTKGTEAEIKSTKNDEEVSDQNKEEEYDQIRFHPVIQLNESEEYSTLRTSRIRNHKPEYLVATTDEEYSTVCHATINVNRRKLSNTETKDLEMSKTRYNMVLHSSQHPAGILPERKAFEQETDCSYDESVPPPES